ncbi:GH32 C-terminal domain-containing protein [Flavobacterium sufflavum]|nr:GH32 C-terminal domain-containing protein [Flavobacterium sufflavum]
MKRIFPVLVILILFLSFTKESKPLYQWSFNSNKIKSTIEENTKTIYQINSNFETPEFVNGIENTGLRFDGYSTYIEGSLSSPLKLPITISVWVALETFPTDTASFFSIIEESSNPENWISASINKFGKPAIAIGINGEEKYYFAEHRLSKSKWFNVCLIINEGNVNLLINGEAILKIPLNKVTSQTTFNSLTIGKNAKEKYLDNLFPLTHINGIIDELKIWNEPLDSNYLIENEIGDKLNKKADLAIPSSRFKNDFNRPKYHLLPAANWTNETHGLIYYKGKYHIFNQKNGTNLFLGQINWGHFSSPDLVQWTEHKPVLTPEEGYDEIGIWSGHVVLDDKGVPLIMYTGGNEKEVGMCLAFPKDDNLIDWEKFSNNPVVKGPPKQYKRRDFRDPYIWKEKDVWYMIVGYGLIENDVQKGALLLYKSNDLKKWTYLHPLFKGNPETDHSGIFWEMPVFWKMNNKYILAVNPIPHDGKPAINLYWVGSFINEKFVPDHKLPKKLEVINRMLSPSVSLDKNGNTTAIAIIPDLITRELQLKHGWTHLFSIPRVWNLKNNEIYQTPHPSLIKLRDSLKVFENVNVNSSSNLKLGRGHQIEIMAEISPLQSEKFGFYIGKNQNNEEETKLSFDLKKNQLIIDQSNSSKIDLIEKRIEIGEINLKNRKTIKIHLFIDGSVVEGFINDKDAFTTRIFPKFANSNEIEIFLENGNILIKKLNFWKLKSSKNLTDF